MTNLKKYGVKSLLSKGLAKGLTQSPEHIAKRVNSYKKYKQKSGLNYEILENLSKYLGKNFVTREDFELLLKVTNV